MKYTKVHVYALNCPKYKSIKDNFANYEKDSQQIE